MWKTKSLQSRGQNRKWKAKPSYLSSWALANQRSPPVGAKGKDPLYAIEIFHFVQNDRSCFLSFYICTVIDPFCFSQPKRHNLRLCYVWPVAAKLVDNKTKEHWFVHCYTNELTDNKTLFCHSEQSEESLDKLKWDISRSLNMTCRPGFRRFGPAYILYLKL